MRVLVLGGEGMLGHKMYQVMSGRFDTFVTFRSPGRWSELPPYRDAGAETLMAGVDALDFDTVVRALASARPAVVVNCVGIVKQLAEANDPLISISINSLFPHRLSDLCEAVGARLVHISTDCVFSGRKGLYAENDPADADDLYGRSKLLGEVTEKRGALTVRTSIIGRDFFRQTALLEWFLSHRGGVVKGYRNAIFSGFPTQVLARIVADILEDHADLAGLYHVASEPISKYDLLVKIRDAMQLDIEVEPFVDPPCDRSLDPSRFVAATGSSLPRWADCVEELANDPTPYDDWRQAHATA